jgi:hypothetical protein
MPEGRTRVIRTLSPVTKEPALRATFTEKFPVPHTFTVAGDPTLPSVSWDQEVRVVMHNRKRRAAPRMNLLRCNITVIVF